ncbi:hypothetical protein [Pseudofrankia saprophytica]|nr:hypothetical protein [Pseudofrankia saprophytica]
MIVLGAELVWVDVATAVTLLTWAAVTAAVALTRLGIRRELLHEGRPAEAGPEPALAAAVAASPTLAASTAVATIVLDLARRGLVDIWRDDRFGVLVQYTDAGSGRGADDPPLAMHETAVLRLIAVRTARGPLPAGALFQEAVPSPSRWRDELVAEAERAAARFQTSRRRRVRRLTTVSVFLVLAVSTFAGLAAARRFVEPEVETEDTINSPAAQWFLVFVLVLLATATISMIVIGGARNEDDGRRRRRWRRVGSGLAADPDLAAAGPEAIGALGHRLVYAAALGHAPAAVKPFESDESPEAAAWTARGGTPRQITIRFETGIDTRGLGASRGNDTHGEARERYGPGRLRYHTDVDDPAGGTGAETLAAGEVVRVWHAPSGAWWLAVHDGASGHAVARRLGLDAAVCPPGVGSVVRLSRDVGARTWSVDVLELAPAQLGVAARPDPTALLDVADLRPLFPGRQIEALPLALGNVSSFRARGAGGPAVTIQCLVFTAGPLRTLLMAGSRRRRLPVPGQVYLRGRVRAVVLVGDLTVAVDITGRRVEDRRALLTTLAWTVSARLGVPVGDPPGSPTGSAHERVTPQVRRGG